MNTNSPADTGDDTAQITHRVLRNGEYVVNHSVVSEGGIPVAVRFDENIPNRLAAQRTTTRSSSFRASVPTVRWLATSIPGSTSPIASRCRRCCVI